MLIHITSPYRLNTKLINIFTYNLCLRFLMLILSTDPNTYALFFVFVLCGSLGRYFNNFLNRIYLCFLFAFVHRFVLVSWINDYLWWNTANISKIFSLANFLSFFFIWSSLPEIRQSYKDQYHANKDFHVYLYYFFIYNDFMSIY